MGEPETLGPDAEFVSLLKKGRFCLQRCEDTGRYVFYPRAVSPYSGSTRLSWHDASGDGVVHSTTIIRRRAEQGGDYNIAIIELAEGPKMMSRVEGIEPGAVAIGMKVKARIADEDGQPLVVFDPA